MSYNCSQCDFTATFESALIMHQQLYHEDDRPLSVTTRQEQSSPLSTQKKDNTLPRASVDSKLLEPKEGRGSKLLSKSSSATRLLGKIRARISKSRTLFSHPEEKAENITFSTPSALTTSKALYATSNLMPSTGNDDERVIYACHLCSFNADRITVLDRHLLNEHKIGLDNLLKLVMAKTKDGLSENPGKEIFGIRQPYYRQSDEIIEEGEFLIETVAPKIKVLKHASTNTEPLLDKRLDDKTLSSEIDKQSSSPLGEFSKEDFLEKMEILNDYMCKYVDSSKILKNVLKKELESKQCIKERRFRNDSFYNLGIGDQSPDECEKAQSEGMERSRKRPGMENLSRTEKAKYPSANFYY